MKVQIQLEVGSGYAKLLNPSCLTVIFIFIFIILKLIRPIIIY